MTEKSFPWTDGTGDGGSYAHSALDDFFEKLYTTDQAASEGVLKGDEGELAVTCTATPVSVAAGSAVVKGKFYVSTAATDVAIPTPTTATRIDRIVLRSNFTAQTIRITRIAGTEGGGAPAITQTDGTSWDVKLAQVSVTTGGAITVTDERTFAHFGTEVSTGMIAAQAVTTACLADLSVTTAKLAASAVTTAKIAAGAVTPTELGAYGRGAYVWSVAGTQSTGTNKGIVYKAPFAGTWTGGYIVCKTAPTGASLIFDVNKAGTTIFTTQANRPTIAAAATSGTIVAPDVTAIAAGDEFTIDCDQVGSTVAGADVTLILAYKYALTT